MIDEQVDQNPAIKKSRKRTKKEDPTQIFTKEALEKDLDMFEKDPYTYIWIIFILSLIVMTVFLKAYIRDMVNISILFLIFWYLEPLMFGATGNTVTTLINRGSKKVPEWKRFPLFFLIIILVYILYSGIQYILDLAFPEEHVNFVVVLLWLALLFTLWIDKFSKELGK